MPHFDEDGYDTWICQICGRVYSTQRAVPAWRVDLTETKSAGNVCKECEDEHRWTGKTGNALRRAVCEPLGIYEHCRRESGGLTGAALTRYVNRYYGHG